MAGTPWGRPEGLPELVNMVWKTTVQKLHGQMEWPETGELAEAKARKRWRKAELTGTGNRWNVETGNRGKKDQLLELVNLLGDQEAACRRPKWEQPRRLHRPRGVGRSTVTRTSLG